MPGLAHFSYFTVLVASAHATNIIAATPPQHPTAYHGAVASIFAEVVLFAPYTAAVRIRAHPIPNPTSDAVVAGAGTVHTIANTSSDYPTPIRYATFSDLFSLSSTYSSDYLGIKPGLGLAHFFYFTVIVASTHATNAIAAIPPQHPTASHRANASILTDVVLSTPYTAAVHIRAHPIPRIRRATFSDPFSLSSTYSSDYLGW